VPKLSGVNHLRAVRALEKAGFKIVNQGKHIVMSDGSRLLTIPRHNPINEGKGPLKNVARSGAGR
jgi:predicted RNA binding protein YcfA (HicA-like mRNA interferase family)